MMRHDINPHIGAIARAILGEPNRTLSTSQQLRFGTRGSIAVEIAGEKRGEFYDFEQQVGGGAYELIRIEGGIPADQIDDWLSRHGFPHKNGHDQSAGPFHVVKTYDYRDENGALLFQVCRLAPKDFRQRRPDGNGGWIWSTKGIRKVPYRLPELLAAPAGATIYIVEGEKDVDNVVNLGLVATCNPGGAAKQQDDNTPAKSKWPDDFSVYFKGRHVVILPDNDEAGHAHALAIAHNLAPVAASVRIVYLAEDWPSMPEKGDVSDWIGFGGNRERLENLAKSAIPFTASIGPSKTSASNAPAKDQRSASTEPGTLTEDAIALIFADRHRNQLRYCHDRGSWYAWDGNLWKHEATALAFDWCRNICREEGGGKSTFGKASTAAGVERFARAARAFAVTSEIWDKDIYLLGTPGGTVDIRTGKLRPSRQNDYITKSTIIAPAEVADCPLWLKFLNEATREDVELIRFLQQWCGYCLTGDISEHALLFLFGPGGNGKGVFLNTVARILGDYAAIAAMDAFTASNNDRHPTDLAMLRGARLVYVSETEEGRAWAENRIKSLTGGDPISARFMRQDFFTYWPQFKITVIGNHKPVLKNVDDANRRRFNLAPFVFKPENPDLGLPEKLESEYPAILRWMIDGALDWQKNGLARPNVVKAATAEYFADQDTIQQWIEDCCVVSEKPPHFADTSKSLIASYKNYALSRGEEPATAKALAQKLITCGFLPIRDTDGIRGRGFKGVKVRVYEAPQPDYDGR